MSILVCSRLCWPVVLVSVIYILTKIRMRWAVLAHDIRIGSIFASICTLNPPISSTYICSQIEIGGVLRITIKSQIMFCPITNVSKTRQSTIVFGLTTHFFWLKCSASLYPSIDPCHFSLFQLIWKFLIFYFKFFYLYVFLLLYQLKVFDLSISELKSLFELLNFFL